MGPRRFGECSRPPSSAPGRADGVPMQVARWVNGVVARPLPSAPRREPTSRPAHIHLRYAPRDMLEGLAMADSRPLHVYGVRSAAREATWSGADAASTRPRPSSASRSPSLRQSCRPRQRPLQPRTQASALALPTGRRAAVDRTRYSSFDLPRSTSGSPPRWSGCAPAAGASGRFSARRPTPSSTARGGQLAGRCRRLPSVRSVPACRSTGGETLAGCAPVRARPARPTTLSVPRHRAELRWSGGPRPLNRPEPLPHAPRDPSRRSRQLPTPAGAWPRSSEKLLLLLRRPELDGGGTSCRITAEGGTCEQDRGRPDDIYSMRAWSRHHLMPQQMIDDARGTGRCPSQRHGQGAGLLVRGRFGLSLG